MAKTFHTIGSKDGHHYECKYHTVTCPVNHCTMTVSVCQLRDHLSNDPHYADEDIYFAAVDGNHLVQLSVRIEAMKANRLIQDFPTFIPFR